MTSTRSSLRPFFRLASLFTASAVLVTATVVACSSSAPATTETHEPNPTAARVPIKDVAWKDMTKPERGAYMRDVVTPQMKAAFVAFDAKYANDFGCATCHGAGVADHSFKMPNPDIFVLKATHEEMAVIAQQKPEWMKFMVEQVKPKMADLLGVPAWDPEKHPDGFGCHACHTVEGHHE